MNKRLQLPGYMLENIPREMTDTLFRLHCVGVCDLCFSKLRMKILRHLRTGLLPEVKQIVRSIHLHKNQKIERSTYKKLVVGKRAYRLHLGREERQLVVVRLGTGYLLTVRATLPDIQQRCRAVLGVGLLEPGGVAQGSVVGEQVDVVGALQWLHAAVQTSGALVVDDISRRHVHLMQPA